MTQPVYDVPSAGYKPGRKGPQVNKGSGADISSRTLLTPVVAKKLLLAPQRAIWWMKWSLERNGDMK